MAWEPCDAADYRALIRLIALKSELVFKSNRQDIAELRLCLTSNQLNPLVHVSWAWREHEASEDLN